MKKPITIQSDRMHIQARTEGEMRSQAYGVLEDILASFKKYSQHGGISDFFSMHCSKIR